MSRKHRRPHHSIYADDSARDLRIFLSSVIIGACIGAFAVYFFAVRPHGQELAALRADVATLSARDQSCSASRNAHVNQREELESRLSSCTASLNRLQRATQQNAEALHADGDGPPLPKPPPGRTAPAPLIAAPVLPEAAPAVVATPVAPVTAPVWPAGWPPRPRMHPARPAGAAASAEAVETAAAGAISGPVATLAGARTATLDVGEEQDMSGYKVRLIAVSRRSSGSYCIVGGNGVISQRIASGSSKRVSWNGHTVNIEATVRDGDTCRIALKPS